MTRLVPVTLPQETIGNFPNRYLKWKKNRLKFCINHDRHPVTLWREALLHKANIILLYQHWLQSFWTPELFAFHCKAMETSFFLWWKLSHLSTYEKEASFLHLFLLQIQEIWRCVHNSFHMSHLRSFVWLFQDKSLWVLDRHLSLSQSKMDKFF